MNRSDWLIRVKDSLVEFLNMLQIPGETGRFLPCTKGLSHEGRQIALGFSCLSLKVYYTLGLWDKLYSKEQKEWIRFIRSFQANGKPMGKWVTHNAFIDKPVIAYLGRQTSCYKRLMDGVLYPNRLTYLQRVIIAETKQALATLAQVGESPNQPYRGFPKTERDVKNYLSNLDWTQPWGSGAQVSALAVFLTSQATGFLKPEEAKQLLDVCRCFIGSLADLETGAYFKGPSPPYEMLINGAMKILTALDWLNGSIHFPERLIDTCLQCLPTSEGCHLVDAIYVLYRCSQQSEHRKADIQTYGKKVLEIIKEHTHRDGGFSYGRQRSQTHYYGVPISKGYAVSDIHGTCLLTWAVAMILEILDDNWVGWNVIRP